jgi:tetratricopeptide (TPR) repeat protein
MEKNRLLDAGGKAFGLILFLAALCVSCSLPRIAVLHDPLTAEEHVSLGISYEKNREFDAALKEYETASSKLPLAYLYMGNVYFQKNQFDKAERLYRKAIDKTGSPYAYNNLAWLYHTTNRDLREAEGLARKAVEISPDVKEFSDTLGKIQDRLREQGISNQ